MNTQPSKTKPTMKDWEGIILPPLKGKKIDGQKILRESRYGGNTCSC